MFQQATLISVSSRAHAQRSACVSRYLVDLFVFEIYA